ncbi:MAG: hypothetical protein HZB31_12905 [Nitrospirae bacterium]|nr:hypothetical protein [Nitrospirota bacterium]
MSRLAGIALIVYCAVLAIMPLSYLHIEEFFPVTALLTSPSHQETDPVVLIHEVLFAHLRNITEQQNRQFDRLFNITEHGSERLLLNVSVLKLGLLSLILAYVFNAAWRYSFERGKALPQVFFSYQFPYHSPPSL